MNGRIVIALAIAAAALQASAVTQNAAGGEKLLARAEHKATVEGNLKGAIEDYRAIAAGAGANRQLAAEALVRMAECYQKLGDAEARAIYQRVVREYADVRGPSARARAGLAALEVPRPAALSGIVSRQIWTGPEVDILGSIAPDGQHLSFVDWQTGGDLAVRTVATGESRRLTNRAPTAIGFALFSRISPDGKSIAYNWMNDDFSWDVRLGPIDGSSHRVLLTAKANTEYAHAEAWSPDGRWIAMALATPDTSRIAIVAAAGGTPRILGDLGRSSPGAMAFSPDSRYLAFDNNSDAAARDIQVIAVDGRGRSALVDHQADDSLLGWMPDGRLLFASDRAGTVDAWMLPVSGGKAQGQPVLAKKDLGNVMTMGLTRSGSLFYSLRTSGPDVYRAPLDPSGKIGTATRIPKRFMDSNIDPDVSADGKRVAFISERAFPPGRIGGRVLCIVDLESGTQRDFNLPLGMMAMPRWSPDGRSLLLRTSGSDSRSVRLFDIESGKLSVVASGPEIQVARWSSDGSAIYLLRTDYSGPDRKAQTSWIVSRNMTTGEEKELFRENSPTRVGDALVNDLAVSPDGSTLVFTVTRARVKSILAMPVTGGTPTEIFRGSADFSIPNFKSLTFSSDGREVIFLRNTPPPGPPNPAVLRAELFAVPLAGGAPRSLGLVADGLSRPQIHAASRQIVFQTGMRTQEVWALDNLK